MSLKKTQQGVASICVRGTHLGFFPLCGGSGEGRRGKSETSCGYWHAVAGTVEPHWRPEASLPLQSHQDRERTRGKGHWDRSSLRQNVTSWPNRVAWWPCPGSALLVGNAILAFLAHVEAVKKRQAILTEYENSWPLSEVWWKYQDLHWQIANSL